jgi:hypothetical protein
LRSVIHFEEQINDGSPVKITLIRPSRQEEFFKNGLVDVKSACFGAGPDDGTAAFTMTAF